jgi:c-di-GMP-related signal transduction protein
MEFLPLNFDLYQGYFLEMPIVTRAKRLPHHRTTLISCS